jgi:hypothetical protein
MASSRPSLLGLALLDDLELPPAQRGVAAVHLARSLGEEVGLLAALGAADLEDDVAPLVGVAGQQQRLEGQFEFGDLALGGVHLGAPLLAVVASGRLVEHLPGRL